MATTDEASTKGLRIPVIRLNLLGMGLKELRPHVGDSPREAMTRAYRAVDVMPGVFMIDAGDPGEELQLGEVITRRAE